MSGERHPIHDKPHHFDPISHRVDECAECGEGREAHRVPVDIAEDTMSFEVRITCRGRKWPYKVIRDEIRKAVSTISGLSFEGIGALMDPDPYDFEDPDNPPEGAR